jgi:hypothetical protein
MRTQVARMVMGLAFVALLTSAADAAAKSAAFKTGTYKVNRTSLLPPGGTVTLKHAQCGGKLQFCVALPKSPAILCKGGPGETYRIGDFATPVALPSSGRVTEHAPFMVNLSPPGQSPLNATGQSVFSITFKKNGTASGYFKESLTYPLLSGESEPLKCSGKAPFTAKLA